MKLKSWQILVSVGYNNMREEKFLFFLEFYGSCEEQMEMRNVLKTALDFMNARERPWSVLIFHPLEANSKVWTRIADIESLFSGA